MAKKKRTKVATHEEMLDRYIGRRGTNRRDKLEFELKLAEVGDGIRYLRKQRKLTQEQLGEMIGVQKAQISKLENGAKNMTIETVLRIFMALRVDVNFRIDPL